MDIKMVKILGAANYLVQLFVKCERKYSCSKTKLEKLLSIANLKCIKNGNKLFDEKVIEIKDCGVGLSYNFPTYLCGDIVLALLNDKNNKATSPKRQIPETDINNSIKHNTQYDKDVNDLTEEDKKCLLNVFLEFGAYDSSILGSLLDEFKYELVNNQVDGEKINFKKCQSFFNRKSDTNNEILKYIIL